VLGAVTRSIGREEHKHRLRSRARVELGQPAARSLEEVRHERETDRS
jgi:hypothetical protein